MSNRLFLAMATILGSLVCASQVAATEITGSINFGAGFVSNGYNPADGGVPPGYGNEGSNTVTVGTGVEFGFQDEYNLDTADFTPNSITIQDTVLDTGSASWTQTFTASSASYFSGLTLQSSTFSPGISYSLSGDTLTVQWPGEYYNGTPTYTATFSVSPAPEPATWALMMAGVAGAGLMLRRLGRKAGLPSGLATAKAGGSSFIRPAAHAETRTPESLRRPRCRPSLTPTSPVPLR